MRIQIKLGDIANQPDMEAVVNSANANLRYGSGVAGAIHIAAGPELELYCQPFAPLGLGCALLSPGFHLPNKWVIHVRAAHYHNHEQPNMVLEEALRAMLRVVKEKQIRTLAIPAIGTGVFKFPSGEAARITAETVSFGIAETDLEVVRFCIPDRDLAAVYQEELSRFF